MKRAVENCVTYLYPGEGPGNPVGGVGQMVDLEKIIRNSAELACGGSSIDFAISVARHLWPVEADEAGLCRVLKTLVANASENMDSGTIRIRADNTSIGPGHALPITGGKYIKIRIEPPHPKNPPTTFPPHSFQGENPNGKESGLAECCSIIQNHGGLIFDESRSGVKTGTIVYLPASDKCNEMKAREVRGKAKVLIMDDEEIIRVVASNMLKHMGYEVDIAANGDEVLSLYWIEKSIGRPFDAIILDLTIRGGMGGAETIKRLLAIDPEINAIVSSGYTHDPIMADFEKYGFKAVLPKPYKMADLNAVLESVIGKNQL